MSLSMDQTQSKAPRPILPPPKTRNMAQRMLGAQEAWDDALAAARGFDSRSVANGTRIFLNMSIFIHELVDDPELCARLVQHVKQKLCDSFPPQQGKLL